MDITAWRERKKQWARFAAWEARNISRLSVAEALRWAGSILAFYLEKNKSPERQMLSPADVNGIMEMHRLMKRWSCS